MVHEELEKARNHFGRCLSQVKFLCGLQARGGHSSPAKRKELLFHPEDSGHLGFNILGLVQPTSSVLYLRVPFLL